MPNSFTWPEMVPVLLQLASDGKSHRVKNYVATVEKFISENFPDQDDQEVRSNTAVDSTVRTGLRNLVKLGLLQQLKTGYASITDEGRLWSATFSFPVPEEEIRRMKRVLRTVNAAEKERDSKDTLKVWIIRSGPEGENETEALHTGRALPGLYFNEEVMAASTEEELRKELAECFSESPKNTVGFFAGQVWRFRHEIAPGDWVLMPSKHHPERIYVGTVTGPAGIDNSQEFEERRNYVPVAWDQEWLEREDFAKDLRSSMSSQLTVFQITRNNAPERVRSIRAGYGDPYIEELDRGAGEDPVFDWVDFFEELAGAIRHFSDDRQPLLKKLHQAAELSGRPSKFQPLWQWDTKGGKEDARDIDPFTIYAVFNRQIKLSDKRAMCAGLKEAFDLHSPVPTRFDGVPERKNMAIRFDTKEAVPGNPEFFDDVWQLFFAALDLAGNHGTQAQFITAFDKVTQSRGAVPFTMGLFWIRPRDFLSLDSKAAAYIKSEETLGLDLSNGLIDAQSYLEVIEKVRNWIPEAGLEPADFVGLSWAASQAKLPEPNLEAAVSEENRKYTTRDIVAAGSFMDKAELDSMLRTWKNKKNIILQGPPGTGKTWLAKRLAYALITTDSDETVTAVQFHPSTSYEDFIQGFRPYQGGLQLQEGPFLRAVRKAKDEENSNDTKTHVIVIEEINRGNPAQIFGEMLTLLEADKRSEASALTTLYEPDGEPVYLPENLYIIGTMNQADRSLAMMDMALRRRFAFINLEPNFGQRWMDFCTENEFMDAEVITAVGQAMEKVNEMIFNDPNLGINYGIGHSFVTPRKDASSLSAEETWAWFKAVVDTDLEPLLREYWFDDSEKVEHALAVFNEVKKAADIRG